MRKSSARGKIKEVLSRLKRRYRDEMETSLHHRNSWELLVATMLSAQSQDAQVNKVTSALFKAYPKIDDYERIKPTTLYRYVKTLGLYRNKAKNIVKAAKKIRQDFNGKVPSSLEKLVTIPGVGRKTANVVLANAFGMNVGIAIDTHCITVANRLFLLKTNNAEKIERALMEFVPRNDWGNLTHLFIALGRDVCTARTKYCNDCVLKDICPSSTVRK